MCGFFFLLFPCVFFILWKSPSLQSVTPVCYVSCACSHLLCLSNQSHLVVFSSSSPLWCSVPTGSSLCTVVLFHFIQTFILYWFIFLVSWPFDLLKSLCFSSADGLRSRHVFFFPSNKSAVHLSGSLLLSMTFHGEILPLTFFLLKCPTNKSCAHFLFTDKRFYFLWDKAAANTTLPYTHSGPEHGSVWAFKLLPRHYSCQDVRLSNQENID